VYPIVFALVYAALWPFYRVKYVHKDRLPKGSTLICANHTNLVDPLLVVLALGPKRQFSVMGKAELFRVPVLGPFLKWVGVFPVNRGKSDVSAIKTALKALANGKRLLLFPEGRRIKTGQISEAKTGAGMLALRGNTMVTPVYITAEKKFFRRCQVVFGESFKPIFEGKPSMRDYQACTEEIMERIRALQRETEAKR